MYLEIQYIFLRRHNPSPI